MKLTYSSTFDMQQSSEFIGYRQQKLHILLIEDNPYDQQLFLEYLSSTVFALSEVTTTEALSEAEILKNQHKIDLVVADLNVADASYSEAINRINRSFGHFPVVLLTGSKDLEMARQAIRSGIQTYLIKDVLNADTVSLAIMQAMEHFNLTQSLKYTINNLYQKSRVQVQITRSISHDYRSPLNNIISLMNLIEQDPDNAELYRQKSLVSAEHMLTHLEETLSILRSPSGVEKPEIIHLDKVLEEVKAQIENELLDADIMCDFVALGAFKYPTYHLKSYLLNLLTNAVKYRHSRRKLVIRIGGRKQNDFVYISVSDNGLGIDMEKYGNRIFGFKQRFHDTAASGTGLGLFNLKNQVESLNGKIEVESEIDKGSTFTLCLPDFSL